jgi:DNA polymerase-3 subunit gamma/tau
MGQALYRKYRSKSLSEIIGQEHITQTLEKALKSGRLSHAYLFTGPRGVGKTSIARILAHEINGLPYTDDSAHLDIIEIDAASNRRIDEIRNLREKVHIAPAQAKYKVYIIDEVHMLTREAFNALLKTLEEPPAHAVFILATTEAHKLPETIVSRTQRFTFKPVERAKVVAHLKTIAKQEKIDITDDALSYIADAGEGSFRDSISLLDQAASQGSKVDLAIVQGLLGVAPKEAIENLLKQLAAGASGGELMRALTLLYEQGYQPAQISYQLSTTLRETLMNEKLVLPQTVTLALLEKLIAVPASHNPERYLEVVLLEIVPLGTYDQIPHSPPPSDPHHKNAKETSPNKSASEQLPKTPAKSESVDPRQIKAEPVLTTPKKAAAPAAPTKHLAPVAIDDTLWPKVLEAIRVKYYTLYSVLKMAQVRFNADGIELQCEFAFHQKRLNEAKNRKIIADVVQELTGRPMSITCGQLVPGQKTENTKQVEAPTSSEPALTSISNIFGGGELLES